MDDFELGELVSSLASCEGLGDADHEFIRRMLRKDDRYTAEESHRIQDLHRRRFEERIKNESEFAERERGDWNHDRETLTSQENTEMSQQAVKEPGSKKFTPAQIAAFKRRYVAEGAAAFAKEFGVSKSSIYSLAYELRKSGQMPPSPATSQSELAGKPRVSQTRSKRMQPVESAAAAEKPRKTLDVTTHVDSVRRELVAALDSDGTGFLNTTLCGMPVRIKLRIESIEMVANS